MNKIILSGNLTRDPEVRYTQSGKAMARMGIAVSRRVARNADTNQPTADFFNLVAWEKTAEFCEKYLAKGSHVVVEGRMQTYSYDGKDGTKKSGVDIVIDNIEFGTNKRDSEPVSRPASENRPAARNYDDEFSGRDIPDDEVPF